MHTHTLTHARTHAHPHTPPPHPAPALHMCGRTHETRVHGAAAHAHTRSPTRAPAPLHAHPGTCALHTRPLPPPSQRPPQAPGKHDDGGHEGDVDANKFDEFMGNDAGGVGAVHGEGLWSWLAILGVGWLRACWWEWEWLSLCEEVCAFGCKLRHNGAG